MSRRSARLSFALLVISVGLWGCTPSPALSPSALPTSVPRPVSPVATPPSDAQPLSAGVDLQPGHVVFSELVPGIPGDNNFEFVELYNAGTTPVDLRGWSVWYQLSDAQEPERIYRWSQTTDIPGYGHVLLVREKADLGVMPDGVYDTPLFEQWGGLQLRDAEDAVVDVLGWGRAPAAFYESAPAPTPAGGASLERAPGGAEGNGSDTDQNGTDFVLRPDPLPQNSGMAIAPLPDQRLAISAVALDAVRPGTDFEVAITVENLTGQDLVDLQVEVPLPENVTLAAIDDALVTEGDMDEVTAETTARWTIPWLAAGAAQARVLTVHSPWQYGTVIFKSYSVSAPDWPVAAYGPLLSVEIAGGAIPIATARTLVGQAVTVEGVATMYTGGFYAGSTGTKFYVQDETGGIQVYCPGGQGEVSVRMGDRVQVSGQIEAYRDALELVPATYPNDVTILAEGAEPEPVTVPIADAISGEALLGSLIRVEGTVGRFEEFSYSYEVDLLGPEGDQMLVYIDKDTRMVPEFLEVGQTYRVTGINEVYDGTRQLQPRVVKDFTRIYPPELMLSLVAQNSVAPGGSVTYTLTAANYTDAPLTDVVVTAQPPLGSVTVVSASNGPQERGDGSLVWTLPQLAAEGGAATMTYTVQVRDGVTAGSFTATARAVAAEWPEPVVTEPWRTFVGSGVPVWAIQGDSARSPFALSEATTMGVVTGVFPEEGGFWIQSLQPDGNALTSEGLFVDTGSLDVALAVGDRVEVRGKVRERSGQTLLQVGALEAIQVITGPFALPQPVLLAPPRDEAASRAYYEALEGMSVALRTPAVAVGPTNQYGETPLVDPGWGIQRVMRGEPKGMLIFADDGSAVTHLDRSTLPYAAKTGDRVGGLVGPLAYTYENYKIQPVITPTVISEPVTLPALMPAGPGSFSIATFNVENFFDVVDPHPSDPPRPGIREYVTQVEKAAATLEAMGAPAIVGFQEVENIGVLEDIAEHPALAAYGYLPVLVEGFDSRGIDVGYLVRGDQATLHGVSQHPAPEGLTSRPPLMITVTVHLDSGDQTVVVLNNHFLSMSGGELATEPRRVAQAAWNATLVHGVLAADPDAYVVVLGDLNSFYDSPPLDVLREAGLSHVYDAVGPDLPYTYIYQGESETLDHILVSPSLYTQLSRVEALHVNADFPPPLPGDTSPEHLSDHDPLVAVFGSE